MSDKQLESFVGTSGEVTVQVPCDLGRRPLMPNGKLARYGDVIGVVKPEHRPGSILKDADHDQ